MSNISIIDPPAKDIPPAKDNGLYELNFNEKVLNYIEQNQPDGSLNDLLEKMRALSPDKAVSMQQLNAALLNADGHMRKNEEYKDYTDGTLDKLAIRLVGVNMFFNNMLYKSFTQSDDDSSL
ncbi:MAG TPA: hypothetical protein VGH05_06255 [Buttiauxella sp.]|jgi:hypothetical protein